MGTNDIKEEIASLGASLFHRGSSVGSAGNISARADDGFLMTPTNSSLGRLSPSSLAVLDSSWRHTEGPRPSKEVVMHRAMYDARPSARAVVHLHSTYVTALSCLESPDDTIPPLTPYFVMRIGQDVPTVPYYRPGSSEIYDELLDAARTGPAVILRNHGSMVAGESLEEAVNAAEELEVSAQLAYLLLDKPKRPLTEQQVRELTGR